MKVTKVNTERREKKRDLSNVQCFNCKIKTKKNFPSFSLKKKI